MGSHLDHGRHISALPDLVVPGLFRRDREVPALPEEVVESLAEQRLIGPALLGRDDTQLPPDGLGKVRSITDDAGAARP